MGEGSIVPLCHAKGSQGTLAIEGLPVPRHKEISTTLQGIAVKAKKRTPKSARRNLDFSEMLVSVHA